MGYPGSRTLALADVLFTNDMASLAIGQVRYGAICDEQGKMIMDGTVFRMADEHCLSITSYDSDLEWFRSVAADRSLEVEVEDRTPQMPHLQVQGPKSRELLGTITDAWRRPGGAALLPVPDRAGGRGRRGVLDFAYRLLGRTRLRALLRAGGRCDEYAALRAGAPHMIRPIGLSAIETLRIESGLLFPDIDYFPHQTDPFEVRLQNVVKLDKPGDFVGRDALRAIAAEGTPRLLTTLRIDGEEVPEYGAAVTLEGREVGIVRSPCQSPTFDMAAWSRWASTVSHAQRPACRGCRGRRQRRRVGGAVSALRHRKCAPAAILARAAGDRTGATACGGRNEPFEDAREALVDATLLELPLHGEHFAAGEPDRLGRLSCAHATTRRPVSSRAIAWWWKELHLGVQAYSRARRARQDAVRGDRDPMTRVLRDLRAGDRGRLDLPPCRPARVGGMLAVGVDQAEILDQRASEGDVEHLHAAADAEQRQVAVDRCAHQRKLELVTLRLGRSVSSALGSCP